MMAWNSTSVVSKVAPLVTCMAVLNPLEVQASGPDDSAVRRQLLLGIDANFRGEPDRAEEIFSSVKTIDPAHPAREFYLATVLFWRDALDPSNPHHDAEITRLLTACLDKATTRLKADDRDVEAMHFAGLCLTYLGRLEAHRGHMYAGGSKGEEGRTFLERGLEVCEESPAQQRPVACTDLAFPLGAYSYYAGRLPRFLQAVNFLWFIPKGGSEKGLELLECSLESDLHRVGTMSLLASIFTLFETTRIDRAVLLSQQLVERYPDNPFLDAEHAHILIAQGQPAAAKRHAEAVLTKVRSKRRGYDNVAELYAELALARAAITTRDLDGADARLERLAGDPRFLASTQTPWIPLYHGRIADLRGQRERARELYRRVLEHEGRTWNRQAEKAAKRGLEQSVDDEI